MLRSVIAEDDGNMREEWHRSVLRDEHGQIPADGLARAIEVRSHMTVQAGDWKEYWAQSHIRDWVFIGPGNIGGRVKGIVPYKENPNIVWCSGASGGVWESFNLGKSWYSNTDFIDNLNVSCLASDPLEADIIYAGTGAETLQGNGIIRSKDGGLTWDLIRSTQSNPDFVAINRIAVSSRDSTILVAATTGLFRSSDEGGHWQRCSTLLGEVYDVHFHPDGIHCVAAGRYGDVYYSANQGGTWSVGQFNVRPPGEGSIKLAYSRSNPQIVYANAQNDIGQLYRSDDGGKSYNPRGPIGTSTLWYSNVLWVDPTDPNTILFGGSVLYRSRDGGITKVFAETPHEDHQIIVEDPRYDGVTNKTVYCGTDGGMFRCDDVLEEPVVPPSYGTSYLKWENLNHNLGITQFMAGAGNLTSGRIIGGSQDNGFLRYQPDAGSENWAAIPGFGDGFDCESDQTDPNYFYMDGPWLTISRSDNGGKSAQYIGYNIPAECGVLPCANWGAPIALDPNDPNRLLAGGLKLWRTKNVKAADPHDIRWASIKDSTGSYITAIAISPNNADVIWIGHLDGSVYSTTNGTSKLPTWTRANGLPQRYCTHIAIGIDNSAYVTFGGFTGGNIWHYDGTWHDISNHLPNAPIYTVVASPTHAGVIYVGTEAGVFATGSNGQSWSPGTGGPAHVAVFGLFFMGESKLVAATFGRGMFTLSQSTH